MAGLQIRPGNWSKKYAYNYEKDRSLGFAIQAFVSQSN